MTKDVQKAHVCFVDIVGYSKHTIKQQTNEVQVLRDSVRKVLSSIEPNLAESPLQIPTGDGIAVCFWGDAERPFILALELNRLIKEYNRHFKSPDLLEIRIGLHSGSVMRVADINSNQSVAGAGFNVAQRVMDLAAPNQILASAEFAENILQIDISRSFLTYAGEYEIKHGNKVKIYNVSGNWKGVRAGDLRPIGHPVTNATSQKQEIPKYGFIIMSFSREDPLLVDVHNCIKEVCHHRNVLAERIDEIEHSGRITDRIVDCIKRADVIIADLSHERPNVYYEIGLAHGQQLDVIMIARHGTNLHFDLANFNVIFFRNNAELTERLEKRLTAVLG